MDPFSGNRLLVLVYIDSSTRSHHLFVNVNISEFRRVKTTTDVGGRPSHFGFHLPE